MINQIDTTAKGTYTIEIQRGGTTVGTPRVISNVITDRGMRRLAGHSLPTFSSGNAESLLYDGVASNLNYIFIGKGSMPLPYTSAFKLGDNLYVQSGGTYWLTYANDPTITGTSWDPSGTKVTFTKAVKIQVQPTLVGTIAISEIGCGPYQATTTTANQHADTAQRSLFSYAEVNPAVIFQAGDTILLKYELELSWASDLTSVMSLTFDNVPGAPAFPNTKTNIRRRPFYDLSSTGVILSNTTGTGAANHNNATTINWTSNTKTSIMPALELLPPVPTSGGYPATPTNYPQVNLHFYNIFQTGVVGSLPNYAGFASTTLTLSAHSASTTDVSTANPQAYVFEAPLYVIKDVVDGDTFKKTLRFLISPGDWPQTALETIPAGRLWGWNMWRGSSTTQIQNNQTALLTNGILTIQDNKYVPDPSHYVGLDYTFSFTRVV